MSYKSIFDAKELEKTPPLFFVSYIPVLFSKAFYVYTTRLKRLLLSPASPSPSTSLSPFLFSPLPFFASAAV